MPERMESTWSSNIRDYGAYWDDVLDVHGHWSEAEDNPDEAEYTLEELRNSVFVVPDFIDWLISHQVEGWSIEGVEVWRGEVPDPSKERPMEEVQVTRITVQFCRHNQV